MRNHHQPKAKEKSYGGHVILPFTERIIRLRAAYLSNLYYNELFMGPVLFVGIVAKIVQVLTSAILLLLIVQSLKLRGYGVSSGTS
jgi:hypothetical protein